MKNTTYSVDIQYRTVHKLAVLPSHQKQHNADSSHNSPTSQMCFSVNLVQNDAGYCCTMDTMMTDK